MTARELFQEAARRGLRLEPRGDKLAVIPGDRVPPEFADVLWAHKSELLSWLEGQAARLREDEKSPGCMLPGKSWLASSTAQTVPQSKASLLACAPLRICSAAALLKGLAFTTAGKPHNEPPRQNARLA